MRLRHCILALTVIGVSGCSSNLELKPRVAVPGTADADRALTEAVTRVDRAMAQMRHDSSAPTTDRALNVPVELRRPFEVNIVNVPLEKAASTLTEAAGYRLAVVNPSNSPSVAVSLNGTRLPLIDLFRSIGSQAGTRADVVVDADTRTVTVQYRGEPNA